MPTMTFATNADNELLIYAYAPSRPTREHCFEMVKKSSLANSGVRFAMEPFDLNEIKRIARGLKGVASQFSLPDEKPETLVPIVLSVVATQRLEEQGRLDPEKAYQTFKLLENDSTGLVLYLIAIVPKPA